MIALLLGFSLAAWAEETSVQPYIDQLRAEAPTDTNSSRPYTEVLKEKIAKEDEKAGVSNESSYIESLKAADPKIAEQPADSDETWLEKEQRKLTTEKSDTPSPIDETLAGKTRKNTKTIGKIRNAFGMRLNAYATRGFVASGGSREFGDIYDSAWYPELTLFYERQLFHHERWGSVGIVGSLGLGFYLGTGKYAFVLTNPVTGESFGEESQTKLNLFSFPTYVGANYRMTLAKYVRPYGQAMIGTVPMFETRNDSRPNRYAFAFTAALSAGINIYLNPLSPRTGAEVEDLMGAELYHFTIDATYQLPLAGQVTYSSFAISAGLTYEY